MIQITPKITAQNLPNLNNNDGIKIAYSTEKRKWIYMHVEAIAANPEKYSMYFSPEDICMNTSGELEKAIDELFQFIKTWSVRSESTDAALEALKKEVLTKVNQNPQKAINDLFDFINTNAVRSSDVNRILSLHRQKIMSCI